MLVCKLYTNAVDEGCPSLDICCFSCPERDTCNAKCEEYDEHEFGCDCENSVYVETKE